MKSIYPRKKQEHKYISKWDAATKEDRITSVRGTPYFCWDGQYYPRKDRAAAHLKRVLRDAGETRSSSWGFRVFKTQRGWGVFARV